MSGGLRAAPSLGGLLGQLTPGGITYQSRSAQAQINAQMQAYQNALQTRMYAAQPTTVGWSSGTWTPSSYPLNMPPLRQAHYQVAKADPNLAASDLMEEFIKYVAEKGLTEKQARDLPVDIFLAYIVMSASTAEGQDASRERERIDTAVEAAKPA